MLKNTRMLVEAGVINRARTKIVGDILKARGGGRFLRPIPRDTHQAQVLASSVRDAIMEHYADLGWRNAKGQPIDQKAAARLLGNMEGVLTVLRPGQPPQQTGDVIAIMRGGKPKYYQVADPLLYRAFASMPRKLETNPILKFANMARRLSQATVTHSVDFVLRNTIMRDPVMGAVLSKFGYVPWVDAAKGLESRITEDANYRTWLMNGGAFASYWRNEAVVEKNLDPWYSKQGIDAANVITSPAKLVRMVEEIMNTSEVATRLSETRKGIRKGEPIRHAVYGGREISVDFARHGDARTMDWMRQSIMFLNPAVQGLNRAYRGFTKDANRGTVAAKTVLVALLSMGLYSLNRDNPLFDQLPDWDRNGNWHFFVPKAEHLESYLETGNMPDVPAAELYHHFRYAKPWEVGGIATVAERTLQGLIDQDPDQAAEVGRAIFDVVRLPVMPVVIGPAAEVFLANEQLYFGRKIETEGMKSLQPWARVGPSTSRNMQALGEDVIRRLPRGAQKVSPVQAEALLRGWLNTWGAYRLMLSDAVFFDDASDLRVDQYPGLRTFYRKEPATSTRHEREFYEMLRAPTEARRTMREMDRTFRPKYADDLERSEENLRYNQMQSVNRAVRGVRNEIKQVQRARTLDQLHAYANNLGREKRLGAKIGKIKLSRQWRDLGGLKRQLLDLWIGEKNDILRTVVEDIEEQERR